MKQYTTILSAAVALLCLLVSCGGADDPQPPAEEEIHYCGRFDTSTPSAPRFAWPGTAIGARFQGTGISVTLTPSPDGDNYFEVIVDGEASDRLKVPTGTTAQTYGLASGLAQGTHDLLIVRRTEGFLGTVAFSGFIVTGGSIVKSPSPWLHGIEVIGDDIAAGYGVLGPSNSPFSPSTESAYASFGSIAARACNAAVHLIAYSGKSVFLGNYGVSTGPISAIYNQTIPDDPSKIWDFSYQPEAVIIELGMIDFSVPEEFKRVSFESAYTSLINLVRSKYATAAIYCICISGDFIPAESITYIENARLASNDSNTHSITLTADPSEGYGVDYRPSAATQARWGTAVAARLKLDFGW